MNNYGWIRKETPVRGKGQEMKTEFDHINFLIIQSAIPTTVHFSQKLKDHSCFGRGWSIIYEGNHSRLDLFYLSGPGYGNVLDPLVTRLLLQHLFSSFQRSGFADLSTRSDSERNHESENLQGFFPSIIAEPHFRRKGHLYLDGINQKNHPRIHVNALHSRMEMRMLTGQFIVFRVGITGF